MQSLKPDVFGIPNEDAKGPTSPEAPPALSLSHGSSRIALASSLLAVVCAIQVVVYFSCGERCTIVIYESDGRLSRLARLAWMSPLYFLAPYSCALLVGVFIHNRGRYIHGVASHRWMFSFALINLFASLLCGPTDMLRDCPPGDDYKVLRFMGSAGEPGWIFLYAICEILLLIIVQRRIELLAQRRAKLFLRSLFVCLISMFACAMVPGLIWSSYIRSSCRFVFAVLFIASYVAIAIVATRALWFAAMSAETAATKRVALGNMVQEGLSEAVVWTRWSAYPTAFSMFCSILLQLTLAVWMHARFPNNFLRCVVEWCAALDFITNSLCVASLSCMIGPKSDARFAEGVYQQVGSFLLQELQDESKFGEDVEQESENVKT